VQEENQMGTGQLRFAWKMANKTEQRVI